MNFNITTKYQPAIFEPARQAGYFFTTFGKLAVQAGNAQKIINADPNRTMLAFFLTTIAPGGQCYVQFGQGGPQMPAMPVPNADTLKFEYEKWGAVVGLDWYASTAIAGSTLSYWEVCFRVTSTPSSQQNLPSERPGSGVSWGQNLRRKRWQT